MLKRWQLYSRCIIFSWPECAVEKLVEILSYFSCFGLDGNFVAYRRVACIKGEIQTGRGEFETNAKGEWRKPRACRWCYAKKQRKKERKKSRTDFFPSKIWLSDCGFKVRPHCTQSNEQHEKALAFNLIWDQIPKGRLWGRWNLFRSKLPLNTLKSSSYFATIMSQLSALIPFLTSSRFRFTKA